MSEPKDLQMPPDYLIWEWQREYCYNPARQAGELYNTLCSKAAQWGADQELDACCNWLEEEGWQGLAEELREARRPKPLSLKQQALEALEAINQADNKLQWQQRSDIIRRALEALPDE